MTLISVCQVSEVSNYLYRLNATLYPRFHYFQFWRNKRNWSSTEFPDTSGTISGGNPRYNVKRCLLSDLSKLIEICYLRLILPGGNRDPKWVEIDTKLAIKKPQRSKSVIIALQHIWNSLTCSDLRCSISFWSRLLWKQNEFFTLTFQ